VPRPKRLRLRRFTVSAQRTAQAGVDSRCKFGTIRDASTFGPSFHQRCDAPSPPSASGRRARFGGVELRGHRLLEQVVKKSAAAMSVAPAFIQPRPFQRVGISQPFSARRTTRPTNPSRTTRFSPPLMRTLIPERTATPPAAAAGVQPDVAPVYKLGRAHRHV